MPLMNLADFVARKLAEVPSIALSEAELRDIYGDERFVLSHSYGNQLASAICRLNAAKIATLETFVEVTSERFIFYMIFAVSREAWMTECQALEAKIIKEAEEPSGIVANIVIEHPEEVIEKKAG